MIAAGPATSFASKLRHGRTLAARLRGRAARLLRPYSLIAAERFVTPVRDLGLVELPEDLVARAAAEPIRVVIATADGTVWRDLAVGGSAPERCLIFEPVPVPAGTVLWFFALAAGAPAMQQILPSLLRRARRLGERPRIELFCAGDPTLARPHGPSFAELSDDPDPALLPALDRPDLDERSLTDRQRSWREDGVVVLRGFMPDAVLDPYIARRAQLNEPGGWDCDSPYEHVPELRRACLYPPLMALLHELIGQEMMLHLTLTGWISTERNWHQDDYLNPPFVNSWYAAAWIALDHIHPDSGPFEYIPGSHRWPLLRREKVWEFLSPDQHRELRERGYRRWPKVTERFVVPAIEREIVARGGMPERFLAEKGDVLIWHGRLLHRGSNPAVPLMERRSLIAHYSAIDHRPDMPQRAKEQGGTYAVFGTPLH